MCRVDEGSLSTVLGAEHRRARKEHRCDECHRLIRTGETYLHERLIFEGAASTERTCAHCQVARAWLVRECGGWVYTEVEEELREHWHEGDYYRTRELARLIYGMGRKWELRRGGLMPMPSLAANGSAGDKQ